MSRLLPGTYVLGASGLAQITRAGRHCGVAGYWIVSPTGDPGTGGNYPIFAPEYLVTPAVIGSTVCPRALGRCICGLRHLRPEGLRRLTGEPRCSHPVHGGDGGACPGCGWVDPAYATFPAPTTKG